MRTQRSWQRDDHHQQPDLSERPGDCDCRGRERSPAAAANHRRQFDERRPHNHQRNAQRLKPKRIVPPRVLQQPSSDNIAVPGQAHVMLGTTTIATDATGRAHRRHVPGACSDRPGGHGNRHFGRRAATSQFATAQSLASPYVVTTTADNGNNTNAIVGSLRQVIENAIRSNSSTATPITFNIPGSGPFVIPLSSALPAITVPVNIEGGSEATYLGMTVGTHTIVEINGGSNNIDGLTLGAGSGNSTIEGLDIADFANSGIAIESSGNQILGNMIGTDPTGTTAGPGNQIGIFISQTGSNNTIGGTASGSANIIAFNTNIGIDVDSGTGNAIRQNAIFQNGTLQNSANIILDFE